MFSQRQRPSVNGVDPGGLRDFDPRKYTGGVEVCFDPPVVKVRGARRLSPPAPI